ncbi:MAG: ABC transporter substrate-binding protein, partial [Acidimicrobiia bacterium]|nr:ABC transporter substrate-binding protein [Acidimicrobiia bacterium]
AVAAINAAGGVNGRPIELLICDDESNPNLSVECGRQAVDEGVVAVVGATSGFGNEYMGVLVDAGIPSIGNLSRSQLELTSPLSFPVGGGIATSLAAIGYGLGEYGATTVHAAIPATGNAAALAGLFLNAGLAPYGLGLKGQTGFPPDAADITPLVQATLEGGTDGVAFVMSPDLINKYLLTLPNLGADPLLVSSTLVYSQTNFDIVGDAAEGLILAGQILPPSYTENPGVQQYHDELDAIGSDAPRSELAINSWAAVHIVADIMRTMDPEGIDSASLVAALESAGEIHFEPLPPFNWAEPIMAYPPASRVFSDYVVLSEVRNGQIVALTGEYVSLTR